MALSITNVLREMQQSQTNLEAVRASVGVLGIAMVSEEESDDVERFAKSIKEAYRAGSADQVVVEDLGALRMAAEESGQLQAVIDDDYWLPEFDELVLGLPIASTVGMKCLSLIVRGDMLLEDLADVAESQKDAIRRSVARQCAVLLFG